MAVVSPTFKCLHQVIIIDVYTVKNGLLLHNNELLLGHVSEIVSILLSKLSGCPNTDT